MIASSVSLARSLFYTVPLAALLVLTGGISGARAGAVAEPETSVAIADLERLTQQLEDPQRREELIHTLRTLLAAAKQQQISGQAAEHQPFASESSQGIFFAFGEFTQRLAAMGRNIGQGLAALPELVARLSLRLQDAAVLRLLLYLALSAGLLAACGILLQLLADRVERKYRARALVSEPMPGRRKVWLAIVALAMAVAPYVALLAISGVVFGILPLGAVASGLAALVIATLLLYRFLRAAASTLFNPERPGARLLPVADDTARYAWTWALRLSLLAAAYLLVTRALLTVGVPPEAFHAGRGLLLLVWAVVLSTLVLQLARRRAEPVVAPALQARQRRWAGIVALLAKVWPLVALTYIWSATLLALFSTQHSSAFIVAASLQTALIIASALALWWLGEFLLHKLVTLNTLVDRYIPGLEVRTLRYLHLLWWGIRALLIVAAILLILQVWGIGIAWLFTSQFGVNLLVRLLTILLTGAAVLVVVDLSTLISEKLIQPTQDGVEASKKRKTLVPLTATVIKSATLFFGALIALHLVGVNVTPILAGVGIFSLAIGFGAQTLVKDVINGLFILVEDSMSVGDVVNIGGTGGLVEAVNLRTIRLRDLQGSVHTIPNSQVEIITNMTKDFSYYVLDVTVAYREDTDEVIAALQEIDTEMRADPAFSSDMLAPIDILGVDRFTDSAVLIKARLKTKPIRQWAVGREFNRRMKKLFDARGIEIPFPHRTIYWGQAKSGETPALPLQLRPQEAFASTPAQGGSETATPPDGGASAR
jgi:small-conductance mechanosensitive channel